MSLLSNLLQYSNNQMTSLMFCESPKEMTLDRNTNELRNLMSARKEETITPEKRTASKSLTKLDLLSFSNAKIDPRERLLHRMVHKVNMKIRKHYYNFFVVLENLKKKNVSPQLQKTTSKIDRSKLQSGIAKMIQLQQILFSKYYSNQFKRTSLNNIAIWGRFKTAFSKLFNIFNRKKTIQSFRAILELSKKIEKQQIRMEILTDSINHIDRSMKKLKRAAYMEIFINKLKANLADYRQNLKKKLLQEYLTPSKPIFQQKVNAVKPLTAAPVAPYSTYKKEKTQLQINIVQQNNQAIKTATKLEESPGKPKQPILLSCQQVKLKIQKCFNYIKNSKIKTNLNEQALPYVFSQQPQYQISKRCEPASLNCHEVPDLNDKSSIFFDQIFSNISVRRQQIEQSAVKILHKKDSISQIFSQQFHTSSQITLIGPLSQHFYEQRKKSISASSVKGSAFGSEAVSFKNSLVIQREMMKEQQEERTKERREFNFAKNKNQLKNQKRAHDEFYQAQSRLRVQGRCESAQRDYGTLKFRKQSDFTITIPQHMISQSANTTSRQAPFIKRNSQTPQPDILRSNYTSERKHLSLMNNNKVQMLQEEGKRNAGTTYLKILSKR